MSTIARMAVQRNVIGNISFEKLLLALETFFLTPRPTRNIDRVEKNIVLEKWKISFDNPKPIESIAR